MLQASLKYSADTTPGPQGSLPVRGVDTQHAVTWKNGYFVFHEPIEAIMRQVARWYGVDVTCQGRTSRGTTVPQNFLIDPQDKVIAKNLRGEELQAKLAQPFAAK